MSSKISKMNQIYREKRLKVEVCIKRSPLVKTTQRAYLKVFETFYLRPQSHSLNFKYKQILLYVKIFITVTRTKTWNSSETV